MGFLYAYLGGSFMVAYIWSLEAQDVTDDKQKTYFMVLMFLWPVVVIASAVHKIFKGK